MFAPPLLMLARPTAAISNPKLRASERKLIDAIEAANGRLQGVHREIAPRISLPVSTLSAAARALVERGLLRQGDGELALVH